MTDESTDERSLPVIDTTEPRTAGELALEGPGSAPPQRPVDPEPLREQLIAALQSVHDPEIPVSIYDLGLIYRLDVDGRGDVKMEMTLTAPGCPVAGDILKQAHERLRSTPGVARVRTELVWDPPWSPERMSAAVRLELGLL